MNVWSITGKLGRDPELKFAANGNAFLTCSIAVSNRVQKDGAWVDETMWVDAVFFGGKRCQWLHDNMGVGQTVEASGELTTRIYMDRDGKPRISHGLHARHLAPCGPLQGGQGRGGGGGSRSGQGGGQGRSQGASHGTRPGTSAYQRQPAEQPEYDGDDDIPF